MVCGKSQHLLNASLLFLASTDATPPISYVSCGVWRFLGVERCSHQALQEAPELGPRQLASEPMSYTTMKLGDLKNFFGGLGRLDGVILSPFFGGDFRF